MSDFKFAFSFPDAPDNFGSDVEIEATRTNVHLKTSTLNTPTLTTIESEDYYECLTPSLHVLTLPIWKKLQTPGGLSFDVVDTNTSGWSNDIIEGLPKDTDLVSGNDYENSNFLHMYHLIVCVRYALFSFIIMTHHERCI